MRYVEDARRKPMDFKLIIDPDKNEQVVVTAHRNSQQIEEIKALAMGKPSKECISGYDPQDEEYRILKIQDVNLFYVDDGKTYASVERGRDYIVKTSLKELEEDLPPSFERINKSSIANWDKIRSFKVRLTGAVYAVFENGVCEDISRRCFAELKRRYSI